MIFPLTSERLFPSCAGCRDLPDDVVLSVPLTFAGGNWAVLSDVTIGQDLSERLRLYANEIRQFSVTK